jgi:uncharacterized membrane protein YfcA
MLLVLLVSRAHFRRRGMHTRQRLVLSAIAIVLCFAGWIFNGSIDGHEFALAVAIVVVLGLGNLFLWRHEKQSQD